MYLGLSVVCVEAATKLQYVESQTLASELWKGELRLIVGLA